jgi:hypothetical protein
MRAVLFQAKNGRQPNLPAVCASPLFKKDHREDIPLRCPLPLPEQALLSDYE